MKKLSSVLLASVLLISAFTATGCSQKDSGLKLGLGVHTSVSATDADEDRDGQGQAVITAAAVLVDEDGKIVKAFIDCAENQVGYTADGTALTSDSFITKYEAGESYGMKAYGGAEKEWFEQADAFCEVIRDKTAAEVISLVSADSKGNDEVIRAGCTIKVDEFAKAVEKAMGNAVVSGANKNDSVRLGFSTSQSTSDAAEDKDGTNKLETTLFAASVSADGTITASSADSIEVTFTFDTDGVTTFDSESAVLTKKEQGDSYGMKAYGGAEKEWYEQADAFAASCIGKNIGEIDSLMGDNYRGNDEVQSAGCTIAVDGFIKAASKLR